MKFLTNAFSGQMISGDFTMKREIVKAEDVPVNDPDMVFAIGHEDTAALVSVILAKPIVADRQHIKLRPGDELYVFQIFGKRLPEGATTLPKSFKYEFHKYTFSK